MKHMFLAVLAVFALAMPALADPPAPGLNVATGGPKGTYAQEFREIKSFCNDSISLTETPTSGSIENLDLLLSNKASAAFVQMDVLYWAAKNDDAVKPQVWTLLALHREEVHVLALANSGLKEGGRFGIGGHEVVLNTVEDLGGRVVGAAGGSYVSAQVIRLQSEIPFKVVKYDSNDRLLDALKSGEVQAAVFVGGQPLGALDKLTGADYKLLPFSSGTIERLKAVYKPAKLKYPKITTSAVPSVSTDALFVTGNYKSPRMVAALKALHDCVLDHLADFQETTGYHAKWRDVDPNNRGQWENVYAFPARENPASAPARSRRR